MNWKEILKTSSILGVIATVLLILTDLVEGDFMIPILLISTLGTGFILNRRLKKNEEWGIVAGMIISLLVFMLLVFLIVNILGL